MPLTFRPARADDRITFPMVLMATRGVSDWTCYLPRNPGFM